MSRSLFCFFILGIWLFQPLSAQNYLWPTNSGTYLSSTFGETRAAHFHAGLDIKTWGREGYKVFATRDGIVHRLQVTERGYGKVVYLRHNDGSYSVYAHLQRFNKDLQAYVDSIRMKNYSFETEIYLDSLQWEIEQGQIIGYTGSSGVGPPHLHFELRDSLENPFNALSADFEIKDNLSPMMPSLIVEPLNSKTRIDGKPYARTYTTVRNEGWYDFGTISLTGQAGLAINAYDMADDVYNKYAVYKLTLLHEGDTLFHEQLDTFSYENEGSNMFLDRIPSFGASNRNHQRLYKKDGAQVPFYRIVTEKAKIQPEDTAQTYFIIASDFLGNTSKARVTIIKDAAAEQNSPALGNDLKNWYWHENWVSPDLQSTLNLMDLPIGQRRVVHQQPSIEQKVVYIGEELPHTFARLEPGKLQITSTTDHRLKLRFGPQSLFDTLTIVSHYTLEDDKARLSIQPGMLPVKSEYKLEFYLPEQFPDGTYRLFRVKKSGGLSYVNSKMIGRTVHAWSSDLGEFIIMADDIAPSAWDFKILKTDSGEWQASVKVGDALSGIASDDVIFSVNNVRGIAEYDYEEKSLIYHLPGFIPKTENTAHIQLSDRAGNTRVFQFED